MLGSETSWGRIGLKIISRRYVGNKVETWVQEILKLSEFAMSQSQAAYAAFSRMNIFSNHSRYGRFTSAFRGSDTASLDSHLIESHDK